MASVSTSGASPWTMRQASPSAMAVLPTPASPTSSGLFLRRRHRTWITRSTSLSRPISGSIRPSLADTFRLVVNCSSAPCWLLLCSCSPSGASSLAGFLGLRGLGDPVGDVVDHVQPGDALLVQVVDGVRILLAEDGDQHIGAGHFLLAVGGGLHVHDGALDHALESERGLGIDLLGTRDDRRVLLDEPGQALAQLVHVRHAGAQDLGSRRVVQQGEQQVLDRDEFVTLLPGLDEGHVQTDFQLLSNHASSITHCSGCWCWREKLQTCSTFVEAMSRG